MSSSNQSIAKKWEGILPREVIKALDERTLKVLYVKKNDDHHNNYYSEKYEDMGESILKHLDRAQERSNLVNQYLFEDSKAIAEAIALINNDIKDAYLQEDERVEKRDVQRVYSHIKPVVRFLGDVRGWREKNKLACQDFEHTKEEYSGKDYFLKSLNQSIRGCKHNGEKINEILELILRDCEGWIDKLAKVEARTRSPELRDQIESLREEIQRWEKEFGV